MDRLKAISISVTLLILGWFLLLKTDVPAWICWSSIILFGGAAILLSAVFIYESITGRRLGYDDAPVFELKDGDNYKVHYSDMKISLIENKTGLVEEMYWKDIFEVFVAAIENNNERRVSWSLHNKRKDAIEIPWGSKGADRLSIELQKRSNEFKQTGNYEIEDYFQGFRIVWEKF